MQSRACSDSAEASRMSMERSFMKRVEKALEREVDMGRLFQFQLFQLKIWHPRSLLYII